MRIDWIDNKREPQCPPNPDFPLGIDVDASGGSRKTCTVSLPYPAKRCGAYVVTCEKCGQSVAATTAGRPDDPRSIKIACQETLH